MEASTLAFTAVIGYLIGSIPFAYIVVHRHARLDLRQHGTGNIGAMNAYDVTGKRHVGITVMTLDMLKGFIPVLLCELLGYHDALLALIPAMVLGHCYPVWLRFRGGRGLATAAGALLLVQPVAVFLWSLGYVIISRIRNDTFTPATLSSMICALLLLFVDDSLIRATTMPISGLRDQPAQLAISILIVLLVILSRFIRPFVRVLQGKSEQG